MAAIMSVWVILWVCLNKNKKKQLQVQQIKLKVFKHYTLTMCLCVVNRNAQYCCPHIHFFIEDKILYYYYYCV